MSWTYVKRFALPFGFLAIALSGITGCAKVTLINQGKAKASAISTDNQIMVMPLPGFAIVSGGGTAHGEGLSVRATVGEVTSEALQTGGDINLWSGIQSSISN
ncbi:MAG: hypothetical protein A2X94_02225 [Bdellovibrionales bacterium GWB1_55_8]|nr:MAG: hypothetical protein A2X94_02225 [Bdellovibrionales bacterium GWB1_55_8]